MPDKQEISMPTKIYIYSFVHKKVFVYLCLPIIKISRGLN